MARQQSTPRFESLEDRRLMSAVSVVSGTLLINGTDKREIVDLKNLGSTIQVSINGAKTSVKSLGVKRVEWNGRGGDDIFTANNVKLPLLAHGGVGNDLIHGSGAKDKLYGDGGNDSLFGLDGDDLLDGGDGVDHLHGGNGNDTLYGGKGDDDLFAELGRDNLDGGDGADRYESNEQTASGVSVDAPDTITIDGGIDRTVNVSPDDTINPRNGIRPAAVTNPQVTSDSSSITLKWGYPSQNPGSFVIDQATDSGSWKRVATVSGTSRQARVSRLAAGVSHTFKIRAVTNDVPSNGVIVTGITANAGSNAPTTPAPITLPATRADQYLVGDFDGDGGDELAARYGNTVYFEKHLGDASPFMKVSFGNGNGDQYLTGDWDGDGRDELAVRRGNVTYYQRTLADTSDESLGAIAIGNGDGDQYLAGDWNGDGRDELAVRQGNVIYTQSNLADNSNQSLGVTAFGNGDGDVYVAGDWDGDGRDELAVRRGASIFYQTDGIASSACAATAYGDGQSEYLVGDWDGDGRDAMAIRAAANGTFWWQSNFDSFYHSGVVTFGN